MPKDTASKRKARAAAVRTKGAAKARKPARAARKVPVQKSAVRKSAAKKPANRKPAPRKPVTQKIVIRDLTLSCLIGVYDEERARRQRIRLNLEFDVTPRRPRADAIEETVDYSKLIASVRQVCLESRLLLLETLAARIADDCFFDPRVQAARIRIEKLDRYADTGGIGVEMEFRRGGR